MNEGENCQHAAHLAVSRYQLRTVKATRKRRVPRKTGNLLANCATQIRASLEGLCWVGLVTVCFYRDNELCYCVDGAVLLYV